jgi:trk system potassium uptake protein TrkH
VKLRQHIYRPLGHVLTGFSAAFVAPIGVSLLYGDGRALPFAAAALLCLVSALLLRWFGRHGDLELRTRDSFLMIAPSYLLMALFAAMPLWFCLPQLTPTEAYFEAMSGLTTTGATVLNGLDALPPSINLWRHQLGWIGGFAALGMTMSAVPLIGLGRLRIYRLQPTGSLRDSQLTPRVNEIVGTLWLIYVALTVLCVLALHVAGMGWFDAVCHALSTLSLTGTSTHDASIAWFHSPLIEFVIALFMLIGSLNFITHFSAWHARNAQPYRRDPEVCASLLLIVASCVLIAVYLASSGVYAGVLAALRHCSFDVISMATSTGFVSSDYALWPLPSALWMMVLTCVACSSGSAGGGIKMIRMQILFRQTGREIDGLVHPHSVRALKLGERIIPDRMVQSVLAFVHLYALSVIVLGFVLMISGVDLLTAFSAILAAINNTAHGVGAVGPGHSFGHFNTFQTWVCIVAMLLGRLELLGLIIPLTPAYWKQ